MLPVQCTDPMVVALLCLVFNNNLLVVWGISGTLGQDQGQSVTLAISYDRTIYLGLLQRQSNSMNFTPSFVIQNLGRIYCYNNGNGSNPASRVGFMFIGY